MITIQEELLNRLRNDLANTMSPKRLRHTLAVEEMAVRLCALFCPEQTVLLRAAALLHDVTKELSTDEQAALCNAYGIPLDAEDLLSPKTLHARTAAAKIPKEFPEFAHPTVIDAVRWHTTGRKGMTLTEKLLYLADYIDESRTFPNCVLLRRCFFEATPEKMSHKERLALLDDTLILSFDMTVRDLLAEGTPIATDTVAARNDLILQTSQRV